MAERFRFTRASVDAARCPPEKSQALFWDTDQPGLGLRVTPTGARAFIFEGWLGGKSLRMTIGPGSMQIRGVKDKQGRLVVPGADTEAGKLAQMVNEGRDPRVVRAEVTAQDAEHRDAARRERAKLDVSGLDAWNAYVQDRKPRWGARHYSDHLKMTAEGGEPRKRLPGVKVRPGELRALLDQPLARIDAEAVEKWVERETKDRPARAALGFRLLVVFFGWLAEHPEYRDIAHADACKARRTREQVAKPARKEDVLQREQLRAWFAEVRKLNPVPAAYLQTLLLTGARREELAGLRWEDVDFTWRSMRIGDKVEGSRVIPLTDHAAALLLELKNLNDRPAIPETLRRRDPEEVVRRVREHKPSPWVFFSRSASGRLVEPRIAHNAALEAAGLPPLTLHGLRRSFGTLAEWVEVPVGVVAQIQGHKPSAIAERHYRRRPLDLLRQWHQRIEAWILTEAGIELPKVNAAPALSVVNGGKAVG